MNVFWKNDCNTLHMFQAYLLQLSVQLLKEELPDPICPVVWPLPHLHDLFLQDTSATHGNLLALLLNPLSTISTWRNSVSDTHFHPSRPLILVLTFILWAPPLFCYSPYNLVSLPTQHRLQYGHSSQNPLLPWSLPSPLAPQPRGPHRKSCGLFH